MIYIFSRKLLIMVLQVYCILYMYIYIYIFTNIISGLFLRFDGKSSKGLYYKINNRITAF